MACRNAACKSHSGKKLYGGLCGQCRAMFLYGWRRNWPAKKKES